MTHLETQRHIESQPHKTPLEILRSGERTERLEIIPLDAVAQDNSLVDEGHAEHLGFDMAKDRGQLIPIAVRAREEEGEIVYDILDGFHRTAGLRGIGRKEVDAKVLYGCDDQEMYEVRILSANSVQSVQFARVAEWISGSFAKTPWAEKGVTVVRAFGATMSNSRQLREVDLSETDVEEMKTWVRERCSKWEKSVGTTYSDLALIHNADPELVRQVRKSGGGKDREGKITPQRLRSVVSAFPGEENFGMQRMFLHIAIKNRLYAEELNQLINFWKTHADSGLTIEEMVKLTLKEVKKFDQKPKVRKKDQVTLMRGELEDLRRKSLQDQEELKGLRDEVASLKEQANSDRNQRVRMQEREDNMRQSMGRLKSENNRLVQDVVPELKDRIRELEAEVENLQRQTVVFESSHPNGNIDISN